MSLPRYPSSFTFISDEVSQDLDVVVGFARKHGLAGFELRSMFGRQFRDLTRTDIAEIRRQVVDQGLRIFGCASPVFKCPLDDRPALQEHRDLFRAAVDTAASLECDLIRVFTCLRLPRPATTGELARVAGYLEELRPLTTGQIRIGVENEASCIVATAAETAALLRLVSPALQVIWDPCNVLYVPEWTGPATEGFEQFVNRIAHVHVKDATRLPNGVVAAPVGQGDVGWAQHLRQCCDLGYRGLFSLETHWRQAALDSTQLHLPGGFAFSAGGLTASEACISALVTMCTKRTPAETVRGSQTMP